MNQTKPEQQCEVCYTPIKHHNLGAPICRSCAAFTRRTINEDIHYVCRTNGRCIKPGLKPKCKACRFALCKKLGAHLSSNVSPKFPDSSSTSNGNSPTQASITTKTPILQLLLNGYDQVLIGQRILFVATHPQMGFSEQYIMPKEIRVVEMMTKCLPLWFAMFVDCYGPLNKLTHEQSVKVVMNSYHEIGILNRNYLTSQHFPKLDDRRLMISNGYYALLDHELWPAFVAETVSVERQPEIQTAAEQMFNKMLKTSREYKRLKIRKADCVILMLLAVYKNAERLNFLSEEMHKFQGSVLYEWNIDLQNELGIDEGNRQMSRIMAYSLENDNHVTDLQNSLLVGQLTWPEEKGCCINQYIEKLTLN